MSEPSSEPPSEPSDAASGKKTAQPEAAKPKLALDDLPHVESPSISPIGDDLKTQDTPIEIGTTPSETTREAAPAETGTPESEQTSTAKVFAFPRKTIGRRLKRRATNAAAIVIAACIGAIAGALTMQGFSPNAPKQEIASVSERQAMQKSIALLAKEVSALKSNIDTASKSSQTQAAKTAARIDSAKPAADKRDDNVVTGSINAPASALPNAIAAATAATITAPLPIPQPRPQLVQGWSVHLAPDGVVLAEQRGGDLYQIAPGVPLPGLGRVEAINRDGGRIEVVTTKGLITSPPRQSVRNRYYRPPPYFEPY
ncbi:MAG: hypothetical protein AB7O50_02190 [Pseudolabrys sp.]